MFDACTLFQTYGLKDYYHIPLQEVNHVSGWYFVWTWDYLECWVHAFGIVHRAGVMDFEKVGELCNNNRVTTPPGRIRNPSICLPAERRLFVFVTPPSKWKKLPGAGTRHEMKWIMSLEIWVDNDDTTSAFGCRMHCIFLSLHRVASEVCILESN
jgi:hypothetical protein